MNQSQLLSHTLHTLSHLVLLYRAQQLIPWALSRNKVGTDGQISRIKLVWEGLRRVWKGRLLRNKT